MANSCRSLDLLRNDRAKNITLFIPQVATGRRNFLVSRKTKNHKPNGTRIAFWADTRQEVDRLAKLVCKAGGKAPEGPEICRRYPAGYYAFFFEDPEGNKLEICCRERPIIAK